MWNSEGSTVDIFIFSNLCYWLVCKIESLAIQIFKAEDNLKTSYSPSPFETQRMEVQLHAPSCFLDIKSSTLVSCIQEREDQIWLYNMLNLIRLLENIFMSVLQFYDKDYDKVNFTYKSTRNRAIMNKMLYYFF